jgi:hypothetical protein
MLTKSFGYIPAIQSYQTIVDRLTARLITVATDPDYLVIGHSLGGLLLRSALGRLDPEVPRPRRLFMLATPNQSPRLARRFHRNPFYRVYTGDAGQLLADAERVRDIPIPDVPTTLVAGTSGTRGGRSIFGEEPNDWIVSLSEVRLSERDDLVTIDAGHTFLMNYRAVADLILQRAVGAGKPG